MADDRIKTPRVTDAPSNDSVLAPRRSGLLVMLFAAAVVSGVAGVLSHAAGNNMAGAVLTGGGAFAGTVGLLLAIALYTRSQ